VSTSDPPILPSWSLDLGPSLLRCAPELACLALLDDALAIAARALSAEHGTLFHDCHPHEPPSLLAARRLLTHAHDLRKAIHRYRVAVLCSTAVSPNADDDAMF